MKLFVKPLVKLSWVLVLIAILAVNGCQTSVMEAAMPKPTGESTGEPKGLMGEWCRVKKRKVTRYTVKPGTLYIRGGRSGRTHEADLTCDDANTVCEAMTNRGWGTPVTEILRLDGENMNLTRLWGGAWKDKSYNFTFTRCPKW